MYRSMQSVNAQYMTGFMVLLILLSLPSHTHAAPPTLDFLWTSQAEFVLDATNIGPFPLNLHFTSMSWQGGEIWAYYNYFYDFDSVRGRYRLGVGRARSTDGLVWIDDGCVLAPGGEWKWWYNAISDLSHQVGFQESDGWAVNSGSPGYLSYGPYGKITSGPKHAGFILQIGSTSGPNDLIATVDVFDATRGVVVASKDIYRNDFTSNWTYQIFDLNFDWPFAVNDLELRTYWHGNGYLKQEWVLVSEGNYLANAYFDHWDDGYASFPGVVKDGSTYYLVYEGAIWRTPDFDYSGDIGVATSQDGVDFYRANPTIILENSGSGWNADDVGTPTLHRDGGTWYLYHHGYNGTDVQIGLATGANLHPTALSTYGSSPILTNPASGWDEGTIGRRSTILQSSVTNLWYMAYEGSTDNVNDWADSSWGTGIARSANKQDWFKYAGNPVTPTAQGIFSYSGPELIEIGGTTYLYVGDPQTPTSTPTSRRYRLDWLP